jgi:hypothetical protein
MNCSGAAAPVLLMVGQTRAIAGLSTRQVPGPNMLYGMYGCSEGPAGVATVQVSESHMVLAGLLVH